ncbi:MAG: hypothetical protein Kow0059_11970 [Candidatus Sumerlaeia bacterium]
MAAVQGGDPLRTAIDEARVRGLRVQAWVHVFFAGFEGAPLMRLAQKRGWLAQRRDGAFASSLEMWEGRGYYFLSPACEDACDFLISNLRTLAAAYDLDALHLDYIRYPLSISSERCEYDYSPRNRSLFSAQHGADPLDLYPEDGRMWQEWNQFREDQITAFVHRLHDEIRAVRPELQLTAAVFGDVDDARGKKFQNWPLWVREGWLNALYFMLYFTDPDVLREKTRLAAESLPAGRRFHWSAGLPAFLGLTLEELNAMNAVARREGAPGLAWFAWNTVPEADAPGLVR